MIDIAICITVFDLDVRPLLKELRNAIIHAQEKAKCQLFVLDDSPESRFRLSEFEVSEYQITYIAKSHNLGRSKARNFLIQQSNSNYCICIDGDARLLDETFIANYVSAITSNQNIQVFIGGTSYETIPYNSKYSLRYSYGNIREETKSIIRNKNPYKSISTFNFCITKSLFEQVQFDESISKYGHEDTLFGLELQANNSRVLHLDNQLIHTGLDVNEVFILKSEQAIKNILQIHKQVGEPLLNFSSLLSTLNLIRKMNLLWLLCIWFTIFKSLLLYQLKSSRPSMFVFDLYKLGYAASVLKSQV